MSRCVGFSIVEVHFISSCFNFHLFSSTNVFKMKCNWYEIGPSVECELITADKCSRSINHSDSKSLRERREARVHSLNILRRQYFLLIIIFIKVLL